LRKPLEHLGLERRRGIDEYIPEKEKAKRIDEVCSKNCNRQSV
jgi:hypothetical protein